MIEQFVHKENWAVEVSTKTKFIVRINQQTFGEQWIEWHIVHAVSPACATLTQTIFFSPRGLSGFLYWYVLYPFHLFRFRGLIHKIVKKSETR